MYWFRVMTTVAVAAVAQGCIGAVGDAGRTDGGSGGGGGHDAGTTSTDAGSGAADAGSGACLNLTGNAVNIAFINRYTDRTLVVTWVDENCQPVEISTLAPQTYLLQITLAGDRWRVKDQATGEVLFDDVAPEPAGTFIFPKGDNQACSAVGDGPVTATFLNKYSDRTLKLSWLDPACKEVDLDQIKPREGVAENTYVGHVFRLRRADTGAVVETVGPVTAEKTYLIPSDGSAPKCSDEWVTPTVVTFKNNYSDKQVKVTWVDYKCVEQPVGTINAGESLSQSTAYTHVFVVRDAATDAILVPATAVSTPDSTVSVP